MPRYIDAILRLAARLRRLADTAKDDYVADVIDGTIRTYWFTATLMLHLAELVNANIDVDSLRKKVDEMVERHHDAGQPAASN